MFTLEGQWKVKHCVANLGIHVNPLIMLIWEKLKKGTNQKILNANWKYRHHMQAKEKWFNTQRVGEKNVHLIQPCILIKCNLKMQWYNIKRASQKISLFDLKHYAAFGTQHKVFWFPQPKKIIILTLTISQNLWDNKDSSMLHLR